jgi:outer membrane protein assembly factor BamB
MNKNKISTAIALFLMFAIAVSLVTLPLANAHDPPWQIPTFAFINVAPDPVGVGQTVAVVMWLDKMPDGTAVGNDIRFHNYKLTITKPDGTTETKMWDVVWDATSSQYTPYTPDQAGTYTFKFEFPGQKYTWTDPIPSMFGGPGAPSAYINDTYLASSATTTITVQEEPVAAYISAYPLPTEYWTRPIEGQNTAWVSIASNYLDPVKYGTAYTFGSIRFQPDGAAPDSPHIMWTKPIQFGGVVGGSNTGVDAATFYTGLSYESRFSKPIIVYGKLYYSLPKSDSISGGFFPAPGGGYVCVDLRTGEQLWWQNYTVNPTFAQLEWFDSPNQHGVISNGYLWAVSGTTWIAYDPLDGNWLFTITDVPSGTREHGPNGELVIYQLDAANNWLALWNITQVITGGAGGAVIWTEGYRPVGKVFNSTERDAYSWNVTISGLPSGSAIGWAIGDDVILGTAGTSGRFPSLGGVGTGTSASYATFWAMSLKSESRGQLMWIKNFSAPAGNITRQLGPIDIENRVFAMSDKETMQWSGYDLDSGDHLWGPVGETRAFNYYPTVGSGGVSQVGFVAYGKLYTGGYGGELFCYDTKNGTLLWKYNNTYCGFETPWGLYPVFPAAIADDKIYIYSGEHSPNAPPYKGSRVRCLNATTGEELWTMLGWAGVGDFSDEGWPVADGYIAYLNAYDMQVYCLGKGPSATSVSIQNDVTTHGNKVLVKGSVIDIAAGTNQAEQAARFPNGVPAVSDESMGEWMEYVYMQKPRPANATGVEVVLTVLDPNENYYEVGRTTSDASGMFSCVFTPEVPGKYTVIATFEGSESYWPSQAETAVYVEEAPAATPAPTPTPAPMTDTYVLGIGAGAIIAIVVIGLVIILMLRKR